MMGSMRCYTLRMTRQNSSSFFIVFSSEQFEKSSFAIVLLHTHGYKTQGEHSAHRNKEVVKSKNFIGHPKISTL